MYEEHDVVALTTHIAAARIYAKGRGKLPRAVSGSPNGLSPGHIGAIVDIDPEHAGYTLEIVDAKGDTIGLAEVSPSEIRPATEADLLARRQAIPERA